MPQSQANTEVTWNLVSGLGGLRVLDRNTLEIKGGNYVDLRQLSRFLPPHLLYP